MLADWGCGNAQAFLPASVTDGRMQSVLDRIMARQRADAACIEPEECLSIPGIVIESSKRPMVVMGMRPSGKSRITAASSRMGGSNRPYGSPDCGMSAPSLLPEKGTN